MGKTAIIILLVIAGVFLLVVTFSIYVVHQNNSPHSNCQETLSPKGIEKGVALLVYQPSKTGNVDKNARSIAEELTKNNYRVVMNCPSVDLSGDIDEYDVVILGSNVYMGHLSKLIVDYASRLSGMENKILGLFSRGNLESKEEFSEIEQLVKGKPRVATTKFVVGSQTTDEQRAQDFVKKLME